MPVYGGGFCVLFEIFHHHRAVMKYILASFLSLLVMYSASATAGGFYLGASTGIVDANVSGFDDATNAGVLAGYDVYSKDVIAVSLEAEFTTTVSDGDVRIQGFRGDWDIDTQAAYLAVRGGDRAYIKVRIGVVHNDVTVRVAGFRENETDTSGSWGGAIGWMFTDHWGVQLDGTAVDSDATYWNLGVKYQF